MSQTTRVFRIQQMLRERGHVSKQTFLQELEISEAQFKRDLAMLRDQFQKQIVYDSAHRAYRLEGGEDGPDIELSGPIYTMAEIHAMLLMQDLVTQLQPELLEEHLRPLRARLNLLLGSAELPSDEIRRSIRILHMASRPVDPVQFRKVSQATLTRRRLHIEYHGRSTDEITERVISPQRLVFYRGNWYVDSWCHLREDLRSFSVDAIQAATVLSEAASKLKEDYLNAHLGSGYGIFAGPATEQAVLRFEPGAARWVAREVWHSRQQRVVEPSGHLVLTIPYANQRELLMDILRYGADVEVLAPDSLREVVKRAIEKALKKY